jgi:hypothetical protein
MLGCIQRQDSAGSSRLFLFPLLHIPFRLFLFLLPWARFQRDERWIKEMNNKLFFCSFLVLPPFQFGHPDTPKRNAGYLAAYCTGGSMFGNSLPPIP